MNHSLKKKEIVIGVAGAGTIGGGVVREVYRQFENFEEETGIKLKIKKIVDTRKERDIFGIPFTSDLKDIIDDKEIDIAVELMGGYNPAFGFIKDSLSKGKHVVTANKAVIDMYGKELNEIALDNKSYLYFEAAVGGGIPIINAIKTGLIGNTTAAIVGILNGTTNYILTRMTEGPEAPAYEAALKEAQAKGFAEADPSFDVEGKDAAQKLAILSSIVFRCKISSDDVYTDGISNITKEDIKFASQFGYVIKLLAIAKRYRNNLELCVHPTMIEESHPLASVSYQTNAIYLDGNAHPMLSGEGAGETATAGAAVISDILNVAKSMQHDYVPIKYFGENTFKIKEAEEIESEFYLKFYGLDMPGTLLNLTGALAKERINISKAEQIRKHRGGYVPIVVFTDFAKQGAIKRAITKVDKKKLRFKSRIRVGIGEQKEELEIYFHEEQREKIRKILGPIDIHYHEHSIVRADIDTGEFSKLRRVFALGKLGVWKSKSWGENKFIKVTNNPNHPKGLFISPFSAEEVKKRGRKTIDELKVGAHRIEFPGKFQDPITDAFSAYKEQEEPMPLVVYKRK